MSAKDNLMKHLENVPECRPLDTRWKRLKNRIGKHGYFSMFSWFVMILSGMVSLMFADGMMSENTTFFIGLGIFFSFFAGTYYIATQYDHYKENTLIDDKQKNQIINVLKRVYHKDPSMRDVCARYTSMLDQPIPKKWWDEMRDLSHQYVQGEEVINIEQSLEDLNCLLADEDIVVDRAPYHQMKV